MGWGGRGIGFDEDMYIQEKKEKNKKIGKGIWLQRVKTFLP